MISKEKILKADIYDGNGNRIVTTNSITFPKDFFKIRGQELVVIKSADLPVMNKADPITVIFEYINGTRIKYETSIDICTGMQLNFHVGSGEVLEERRSSFKINTDCNGVCRFYERGGDLENPIIFEEPLNVHFININVGGVLFYSDFEFRAGDHVNLSFLDGKIDLIGEVLRIQNDSEDKFIGYGCKFLNVTHAQEDVLAKYILDCQLAEREKRRAKAGGL